jgi:hypothetical protein
MVKTSQWIKKLGGHAGELYVAAELSKRGIPNSLLPENFSGDDIIIGKKNGSEIGYVQVKACHPDRAKSFLLKKEDELWRKASDNAFLVLVYLGSPKTKESPRYWVATKKEAGEFCVRHPAHGTSNWERRIWLRDLETNEVLKKWEERWELFNEYLPDVSGD